MSVHHLEPAAAQSRTAPARPQPLVLLAYLAVLALAEVLAAGIDFQLGLWLHAGLLGTLLVHSVFTEGASYQLYVALSVLPLIRLLSLTMPFWLTDRTGMFALVNVPLIVGTIVAARVLGYGRSDLKLRTGSLPIQFLIALSGIAIGILERYIIQPPALAEELTFAAVLWPALSLLLFTGLSEELLFRGVLQRAAVDGLGARRGIFYGALTFGILHTGWNSFPDVVFVTLAGLYFGWVVHRTGSLLGVVLAHGFANIMLFIVLPLLGQ